MNRMITLALALLALACGEEEPPPPPPPVSTPVEVLKNIEISFNRRDIDLLKNCLSPNFVFYTDPGEIGRPKPAESYYRPPPCYTFTEFWNIAYNMFKGAYSVSLSISTGRVGEPAPEENTYWADKVELSLLVMVDELNGYIADEGYCHFEFEKYKNEQGQVRWRITNWWDDTEGGGEALAGVERVPLWYILSLYEKPT
ncbi:MAG TPA: hypothetical protein VMX79_01535 [bacterium]|nr:hypothetical protein [bacterium]